MMSYNKLANYTIETNKQVITTINARVKRQPKSGGDEDVSHHTLGGVLISIGEVGNNECFHKNKCLTLCLREPSSMNAQVPSHYG